ncbi:MAG: hypothetical protein H6591_01380 [Flavobacteriales bacterium]|nr:hypothetical protein [Flavobacteriales bacterium]
MMRFNLLSPRLLSAVLTAQLVLPLTAQLLSGHRVQRGGGVLQTCDTSMHVDFTIDLLDDFVCHFQPVVTAGTTSIASQSWHYYADDTWWEAFGSPTIPYYSETPYPMCLQVEAYDQTAMQPCSTTVCKVVQPLAHAICQGLTADFGIAAVQDSTITFQSLAQFTDGLIASEFWSFGDASLPTSASSTHTFSGAGPFQICLTVVGAPPENCVTQECQWLYMGPGGLPCEALIDQGFIVLQANEWVGVIDTSWTTGAQVSRSWDFGDGTYAEGLVAAHAYATPQPVQLCGTLRAWGPQLADTCESTLCQDVWPFPLLGVTEPGSRESFRAWPSPFTDALLVRAPAGLADEVRVVDATGRLMLRVAGRANGEQVIQLAHLAPGAYTVICVGPAGTAARTVLKQ